MQRVLPEECTKKVYGQCDILELTPEARGNSKPSSALETLGHMHKYNANKKTIKLFVHID